MNNPDHISESLEKFFWVKILRFCGEDPGWKKFRSGIRNKHPGSAMLRKKFSIKKCLVLCQKGNENSFGMEPKGHSYARFR
jgi:hypothetical protein